MQQNFSIEQFTKIIFLILFRDQLSQKGSSSSTSRIILLFLLFSYGACIGSNQSYIKNGDFSTPVAINRSAYIYSSILGWNCTWMCQIKNCQIQTTYWKTLGYILANCITQAIDLNSNLYNQKVSQQIQLSTGLYSLSFNYYYPVMKATVKELKVHFNNDTVLYIQPTINNSTLKYFHQIIVNGRDGVNILMFQNLGLNDGYGFKINNVSLYNYTIQKQNTFLSQFVRLFFQQSSFTNNVPGARVIFRSLLSFLINFDRLQLYIYHNRNYSPNAQLLLEQVNNFLNTKTNLITNALNILSRSIVQTKNSLANSTNYKEKYIFYNSFSKEYQAPQYLDNFNQSFTYFFPFIIIFVIILNILFKILFQKPISLLFRKFELWAIIFIMMFDGNIENMTFHTLKEYKILFSTNFSHKLLNFFMVMFFYLLFFIVFALLFWVKYHYGKKAKYILDEQRARMNIMWGIIIDRGIICFLFGIVHQLLINYPDTQLLFLAIIELVWVVKKIIFIYRELYQQKLLIIAGMLNGFCRIFLQLKFEVFNQRIHSLFFNYAIISTALFEIFIGLFYCFKFIYSICRLNKRKIGNKSSAKQIKAIKEIKKKQKKQRSPKILQLPKIQITNALNQVSFSYSYKGRPLKFRRNLRQFNSKIIKAKQEKAKIVR